MSQRTPIVYVLAVWPPVALRLEPGRYDCLVGGDLVAQQFEASAAVHAVLDELLVFDAILGGVVAVRQKAGRSSAREIAPIHPEKTGFRENSSTERARSRIGFHCLRSLTS